MQVGCKHKGGNGWSDQPFQKGDKPFNRRQLVRPGCASAAVSAPYSKRAWETTPANIVEADSKEHIRRSVSYPAVQ